MSRRAATALIAAGIAGTITLGLGVAPSAWAYTKNADGTYAVTTAELKEVFGNDVNIADISFHLEDGYTWYAVPCKKKNPAKETTRDFKRQTHTEQSMTAVATATGFTLTATGTVNTDGNVRCPSGWTSGGSPKVLAKSTAMDVMAVYNGIDVELPTA